MKFVIQRVSEARVEVNGTITGQIAQGLLVFVGFTDSDTPEVCIKMLHKTIKLRVFETDGKMNLSVGDIQGALLIVPQFTLYANLFKGNRPSFTEALEPVRAAELFSICKEKSEQMVSSGFGVFGADMKVHLLNDGPITLVLDSRDF